MHLSLKARPRRGYIVLPQGLSDVKAMQFLLPGSPKEVATAIDALSSGTDPLIRFEDRDGKRIVVVVNWQKWNPSHDDSSKRVSDYRQRKRNALHWVTETPANAGVTPRARALISSVSSDLSSESLSPSETLSSTRERPPGTGPLPDGVVLFEKKAWVEAYTEAVKAAGYPTFTFPAKAFSALRAVVEGLCVGEDRKDIPAWITRDVAGFMAAIRKDDPRVWSAFSPDGLQRWHAAQKGPEEASAPMQEHPLSRPFKREMTLAESADAMQAVLDSVAGIGIGGAQRGR